MDQGELLQDLALKLDLANMELQAIERSSRSPPHSRRTEAPHRKNRASLPNKRGTFGLSHRHLELHGRIGGLPRHLRHGRDRREP